MENVLAMLLTLVPLRPTVSRTKKKGRRGKERVECALFVT